MDKLKVKCIQNYKKMLVGETYEYYISRSGQSINVIIDNNTHYSFNRYKPCHFKGNNEDIGYVEYIIK